MTQLLHELVSRGAARSPGAEALVYRSQRLSYEALAAAVAGARNAFLEHGLGRGERVAIYLEKRIEFVAAAFGAAAAGGIFVPTNPLLKAEQVAYILRDCGVRALVTSSERYEAIAEQLAHCPDLQTVYLVNVQAGADLPKTKTVLDWAAAVASAPDRPGYRNIDADVTAIFYTSGSTGRPKGVVLSHRNMVVGAYSVAEYLNNGPHDRILAALPLSFDAGFSQLTTSFRAGACAVLINYLLPKDIVNACVDERITGLTGVPPLWIQLAELSWPAAVRDTLRYFANTGGRMPKATLDALRAALPKSLPYLMYGLTEAFRSTYLPPSEVDHRPDSIGKAIPNAEILVVREDGSPCAPNEPGELVHRGALVSLGYWNDPERTRERFRPVPGQPPGITLPEMAVWSGDTVRMDEEGYLYFVGRRDEMIKTSGYRVSPTEVEEVVYATGLVGEAAALGIPHPTLGQAIVLIVTARADAKVDLDLLLQECRARLPAYMVPAKIEVMEGSLPRNPNGKIDRKLLAVARQAMFEPGPDGS